MFMNIYFYFSISFLKFFFSFGTFFFSESKKRCITIRFRWGLTELESLRGLVKLTAEKIYILLSSLVSFSRETNGKWREKRVPEEEGTEQKELPVREASLRSEEDRSSHSCLAHPPFCSVPILLNQSMRGKRV